MPYDSFGNWTDDYSSINDWGVTTDPQPEPTTDWTYDPGTPGVYYDADGNAAGGGTTPINTSDVVVNNDGSVSVTNQDGTVSQYPAGAQRDANGNIYDKNGNLLKQIAALSPVLTALATPYINNLMSGGLLNQANDLLKAAGKGISNLTAPDLMSMIPILQLQVQQGTMSPAQANAAFAQMQGRMSPAEAVAFQQQASKMSSVGTDQQSLTGARTALTQLGDIAQNRGLTDADRAQFNALMNQQNANAAQQRAAQIQQLQMQGNAGTGAELAARLSGVQSSANANAAAGANLATSAQQRALQAIQSGLQGNTSLNQQLFGQEADKAKAQDVVNQFNTAAKNAVNLANAGFTQQANQQNFNTANQFALQNAQNQQAANLANAGYQQSSNLANFNMANDITGKNVGIQNQNLMLPSQFANQQFTNQLNQQKGAADAQVAAGTALGNMATGQITRTGTAAGNAAATPTTIQSSGGGGGGNSDLQDVNTAVNIGSTLWNLFSDEKLKTDKKELNDDDVDTMMAKMTGYKYRYKGSSSNPVKTGVMAQDMERGQGNSVIDTPAGKMIQGPEALSNALAILANQHDRIRKLEGK